MIPTHPLVRKFSYFTEAFFYLLVLFGPWALGTTQSWSIFTLSIGSGCFLILAAILKFMNWYFTRHYHEEEELSQKHSIWNWADWVFIILSILCLLYVCIQWLNAQSDYIFSEYRFIDFPFKEWLPSSTDKNYTLFYLYQYLGLFSAYLGARLLFSIGSSHSVKTISPQIERFFWVVLSSAFILVIVGILMRLDKTPKLLWFVERRSEYSQYLRHFGPFGYRSSAAQYLNLLWPLGISIWWVLRSHLERKGIPFVKTFMTHYLPLAIMSLFLFVGVWVAVSRGGVWIGSAVAILLSTIILFDAFSGKKKSLFLGLAIIIFITAGTILGLKVLGKDAERLSDIESDPRIIQYMGSWPIYYDYPTYGVGAGSYACMFELYAEDQELPAGTIYPVAHSDWLQLLIEFGNVGTSLVVLLLIWGLIIPWISSRGSPLLRISFLLAFSTALIHAVVDMPFYVLSISWIFVVLMAVYHSLPLYRKNSHSIVIRRKRKRRVIKSGESRNEINGSSSEGMVKTERPEAI